MLKKALKGAESIGAKTELIHLQDYNFLGCRGCMACKQIKNAPPSGCLQNDALTPILKKVVYEADSLLIGGPIYMMQPNGIFRSFSERLLYPYFIYGGFPNNSYYPRKDQKCGLIFTMGAPKSMIDDYTCNKNSQDSMDVWENFYKGTFGKVEILKVYLTYHVKKFDGYELDCLNEPARKEYHEITWRRDLKKAYNMGKKLAEFY